MDLLSKAKHKATPVARVSGSEFNVRNQRREVGELNTRTLARARAKGTNHTFVRNRGLIKEYRANTHAFRQRIVPA